MKMLFAWAMALKEHIMPKREDERRVPQVAVLDEVNSRFQGVERTLEGVAMQLGAIEANQRTIMRYLRLDYISDRRREDQMSRTLDEALDAVRRSNTLADGLIESHKALKDEIKNTVKLTPEQQSKIDTIFDDADAQAKELSDALVANTPNENPSGGASAGGASAGGASAGGENQ